MRWTDDAFSGNSHGRTLDIVQTRSVVSSKIALEVDANDTVPTLAFPEIGQHDVGIESEISAEFERDVGVGVRGDEILVDGVKALFEDDGLELADSWPALGFCARGGDRIVQTADGSEE